MIKKEQKDERLNKEENREQRKVKRVNRYILLKKMVALNGNRKQIRDGQNESTPFSTYYLPSLSMSRCGFRHHFFDSQGTLAGASMRHLRSGHSHEDIDQCFGSLSLFLVRHGKCVESPPQFIKLIQTFCSTAHRPFEPERFERGWQHFIFVRKRTCAVLLVVPFFKLCTCFRQKYWQERLLEWRSAMHASWHGRPRRPTPFSDQQTWRSWCFGSKVLKWCISKGPGLRMTCFWMSSVISDFGHDTISLGTLLCCGCLPIHQGSEAVSAVDTYWKLAECEQRGNDIMIQCPSLITRNDRWIARPSNNFLL